MVKIVPELPNTFILMKKIPFVLFVLLWSVSLMAQDFEGIIVYKISYTDLPSEMKGSEEMMPKSQTFYIKKEKAKFEMVTPMGTTIIFSDSKQHTSTVLMNTMGGKYKLTFSTEDLDEIESDKSSKYDINYLDEEKTIAGYLCKKVEVQSRDLNQTLEIFYTEEIQPMNIKGLEGLNIKGMPMEYLIKTEEMSMTVTVDKVEEKSIGEDVFVIPEGYQEMPESMKNMMKKR